MKIKVEVFLTDDARFTGIVKSVVMELPDEECEEHPVTVMDKIHDKAHEMINKSIDFKYELVEG